jgi:hypothetical protein
MIFNFYFPYPEPYQRPTEEVILKLCPPRFGNKNDLIENLNRIVPIYRPDGTHETRKIAATWHAGPPTDDELKAELGGGRPMIAVCPSDNNVSHVILIYGFVPERDGLQILDPYPELVNPNGERMIFRRSVSETWIVKVK